MKHDDAISRDPLELSEATEGMVIDELTSDEKNLVSYYKLKNGL